MEKDRRRTVYQKREKEQFASISIEEQMAFKRGSYSSTMG